MVIMQHTDMQTLRASIYARPECVPALFCVKAGTYTARTASARWGRQSLGPLARIGTQCGGSTPWRQDESIGQGGGRACQLSACWS